MVEYLGTVNGIITKTELKALVSFGSDGGDITFHKFKEDNVLYLLPNENLKNSVFYSDLASRNLVNGKNITIKNTVYNIRLLTGGNGNPSNGAGGEWDKFIVTNSLSSQFDTNYFWCQEADSVGGNGYYVTRKGTKYLGMSQTVSVWGGVYTGWLPVLVLSCNLLNSITSQDLGNLTLWANKSYEITGDTYTLTEKIDGEVFRTLPNQASGTPQILDISSKWNELGYGSHTIEIIATDSNGLSSIVEITFNKIKEITKPIPITSSLKEFVNHVDNVGKDVDYLRCKLKNNLIEKGVECSDSDKMSSLIDKVNELGDAPPAIPDYLYKSGDEYRDFTGGFEGQDFYQKYKYGYSKKRETYLEFGDNTTSYYTAGGFVTNNKIDFTDIDSLELLVSTVSVSGNNAKFRAGLTFKNRGIESDSSTPTDFKTLVEARGALNNNKIIIDTSNISEEFYVAFLGDNNTYTSSTVVYRVDYIKVNKVVK